MNEGMVLKYVNTILAQGFGIDNAIDGEEEVADIMSEYDLTDEDMTKLARGLSRQFRVELAREDILEKQTIGDVVELIMEKING
ncbi:hypothetical protein KKC88_00195 [Patescibacteria group bacterium]|nr:hypothetical protein [Patescibacteria group bacterium]MBU1673443.1 hypothetical protein [Patescibacteria group bacterium]MBU1963356.1 hypothetical protein [Patescibacteria group bacterium]